MRPAVIFFLATSLAFPCSWDYPIWSIRDRSADPLYRFVRGDKAGYIDEKGKVVIAPAFSAGSNQGGEFHDGRLKIEIGAARYVDMSGNPIVFKNVQSGSDFSDGLAVAMRVGEKLVGYVNPAGEFAIAPRFASSQHSDVSSFKGGFASIRVGDKLGYIGHTGEFVVQPRFLDAGEFHEGLARVVVEGPCVRVGPDPCFRFSVIPESARGKQDLPLCKFAYTDTAGRTISEQRFDAAGNFSEGLAPVKVDKFWGYIDKSGKSIILPLFDDAEPFSEGLARVRERGRWGYIDKSGVHAIRPAFEYAEDFHEGFAVVGNQTDGEDEYWYIGKSGEQAIRLHFGAAGSFFHGLAHVRLLGDEDDQDERATFAYIDTGGRVVFSYTP